MNDFRALAVDVNQWHSTSLSTNYMIYQVGIYVDYLSAGGERLIKGIELSRDDFNHLKITNDYFGYRNKNDPQLNDELKEKLSEIFSNLLNNWINIYLEKHPRDNPNHVFTIIKYLWDNGKPIPGDATINYGWVWLEDMKNDLVINRDPETHYRGHDSNPDHRRQRILSKNKDKINCKQTLYGLLHKLTLYPYPILERDTTEIRKYDRSPPDKEKITPRYRINPKIFTINIKSPDQNASIEVLYAMHLEVINNFFIQRNECLNLGHENGILKSRLFFAEKRLKELGIDDPKSEIENEWKKARTLKTPNNYISKIKIDQEELRLKLDDLKSKVESQMYGKAKVKMILDMIKPGYVHTEKMINELSKKIEENPIAFLENPDNYHLFAIGGESKPEGQSDKGFKQELDFILHKNIKNEDTDPPDY